MGDSGFSGAFFDLRPLALPVGARTLPRMKTSIEHDTDIAEIASRLIEFCRRGDFVGAQKALFAQDAVSIEPEGSAHGKITKGLTAIVKKSEAFSKAFEVHRTTVSEPVTAGKCFACSMTFDVTERSSGEQMPLSEICVYEVRDGKVVREQFFYEP